MRPDEHKKKKNAAYKKKHGIGPHVSLDEKATPVSSDKVDKKRVDKRGKNIPQQLQITKEMAKSRTVSQSNDEESSDSDDSHQMAPKRKQFSRREIVSNWKKYEIELEEEEKVKAKGEKYEVLLGMAGEAMSRFRFRDELEWEDEPSNEDAKVNGEQQSHLQLNPADLVQSLACIPVHQILGVEQEMFPKDQLESILQTAAKNQALYSSRQSANSNLTPTLNVALNSNLNEEERKPTAKSSSHVIVQTTEPISSSSSTSKITKDMDCVKTHASQVNPPKLNQVLGLQDDDLDKLLDMDLDTEKNVTDDSSTSHIVSGNDTDSLTTNAAHADSEQKKENEESENLEEWLDSILD